MIPAFAHATRWLKLGAWYAQPLARRIARNQAHLDRFVISFDELHREAARQRSRALLFTHIPKTGGTTFEYIAAKNHTINGTIQINSAAFHRNPNALFKSGSFPKVTLGHHALGQALYHFIDRPLAHVTIIREPTARIISHYNYVKHGRGHALHTRVRDLSLADYVASDASVELENAQTFRLSGDLHRTPGRLPADGGAALARAKANLETRFSFFGLTERYVEFLLMCRTLLGWQDIYAVRRNVSMRTADADVPDPAVIEQIRERNHLDCALYEHAQDIFNVRCTSLGIGPAEVERYAAANAQYEDLLASA